MSTRRRLFILAICAFAVILGLGVFVIFHGMKNFPQATLPVAESLSAPSVKPVETQVAAADSAPATLPIELIHYVQDPKNGTELALAAASRLLGTSYGKRGDVLVIHPPLPVYTFSITSAGLNDAQASGRFVYYADDGGKQVAAVDLQHDDAADSSRAYHVATTPTINLAKALDQIAALPALKGSFEIRQLIIRFESPNATPLYVLWLKSDAGPTEDWLYTYGAFTRGAIPAQTLFKPADLLAQLRR